AEHGVLRVSAGEPADPAGHPALFAHGLRQPRRLLAHARRAEQAQAARLLLSEPRDPRPLPRDQGRHDRRRLGLHGAWPLQQPADYDLTEEEERVYWQDFISHLNVMTGKRLKGRLGGGAGYTVRTDDLMAEAGCLYHT